MANNLFYIILSNWITTGEKYIIKKSMDLNATTEFRDHNIIIYIMKNAYIFH